MNDWFVLVIAALLPVTALFAVLQRRPYYALISRGIMGVVAVMLYAVLGAADVALTEALVGTLLTVLLFAIAVRTSLAVRIGRMADAARGSGEESVRQFCDAQKLYQRRVAFDNEKELVSALKAGRVDAVCVAPRNAPMLKRYLPGGLPEETSVILLAEHALWHERKMKEQFDDSVPVFRLNYRDTERKK